MNNQGANSIHYVNLTDKYSYLVEMNDRTQK